MRKNLEAGSLTKDDFEKAFNSVSPLPEQPTHKAFEHRLTTYMEASNNADKDFRICNKTLIDIRSILKHDENAKDFLMSMLAPLIEVLLSSVKDKRSAVMREGCFTVAMFVKTFGNEVLAFALDALDALIPYSQSSIRVMSSGATIASIYICEHIRSVKVFINLLELVRNSKSRFVRGAVIEMVQVIVDNWPVDSLRKCSGKIRELVDIGVADAGPSAREAARESLNILSKKMPDLFQALPAARSASRGRNFYDNRAATDMSSRMLSKRIGMTESSRAPVRPKFSVSHDITHAPITMRSRTPNATSSSAKANSQPGSRHNSPPGRNNFIPQSASKIRTGIASAQPRRLPEAHKDLGPITPPRLTPKRSAAIRPNVVTAQEAYSRAQMSRDSIRNFNNLSFENDAKSLSFDPDLNSVSAPTHKKSNGINGESGDLMRSKSTNNASVSSTWKSTSPSELSGNSRAQSIYLNAVLDAISLNDKKNVPTEAETALVELNVILRAEVITIWDTYFNPLFSKIVDVISVQSVDAKVRCAAAQCLLHLIIHSRGIDKKCSMLVNRLIEIQVSNAKDLALSKAIEECTVAISQAVDFRVLLPVLKNIIRAHDQSSLKSAAAVKIISHAVFRQQPSDVMELIDSTVPLVFQLYESSSESAIRRDCVICLVVFSNKVSMPIIRPHISNAMEKLIDVYGKRPIMSNWNGAKK